MCNKLMAQQHITSDTIGTVIFTVDDRLDKVRLVPSSIGSSGTRVAKKDDKGNYLPVLVNGFRLQVLTTIDRNQADQMKARLYSLFPGQKAYRISKPPYYSVQVGDYYSMEEAQRARSYASKALNQAIYIVTAKLMALPPEAGNKQPNSK